MSLLSRIRRSLRGAGPQPDEPETLRRIAAEFEGASPERARFLGAFAYVLARVAHADLQVDANELRQIESTLVEMGELDATEARIAAQIAVDRAVAGGGTDDYVVTRALRELTEKPQRVRLMRCLLAVAAADESISSHESNELASIGEELGFSRKEISALRYEFRDKLAELQHRVPGERD